MPLLIAALPDCSISRPVFQFSVCDASLRVICARNGENCRTLCCW